MLSAIVAMLLFLTVCALLLACMELGVHRIRTRFEQRSKNAKTKPRP